MAALTGTLAYSTPLASKRIIIITTGAPTSASDTVTLTTATHGIRTIYAVVPMILTGQDADLATIYATFSGLGITVKTLNAAGGNATDWTSATTQLLIIGD